MAFLLGKILVSAYYRRNDPTLRKDLGKIIFVAGVSIYLLGSFLWEVWKHPWF